MERNKWLWNDVNDSRMKWLRNEMNDFGIKWLTYKKKWITLEYGFGLKLTDPEWLLISRVKWIVQDLNNCLKIEVNCPTMRRVGWVIVAHKWNESLWNKVKETENKNDSWNIEMTLETIAWLKNHRSNSKLLTLEIF